MEKPSPDFARVRELSPRRNTTRSAAIPELVDEQLRHFSIDPQSEFGRRMADFATHLYAGNAAAHQLWEVTLRELADLDPRDRVARFNAKRFLCFQLAKILDTLQNPLRKSYQSLLHDSTQSAIKGPYPIFDNVTAIFSATPVITRTATYLYACTEWVEDAFKGREPLHEIYSRLLNPTSISLANHIVDLEAGPLAGEYLAWNFNSGMAAIDATLSNLVGYNDVVLSNRNVYGGTYQLLHDWYAKKSNLDVAVEWFDGFTVDDFGRALQATLREAPRSPRPRPPHLRLPGVALQPARVRARRARRSAAPRTNTDSRSSVTRPSARRSCSRCCSARTRWSAPTSSYIRTPRTSRARAPRRPASASAATSACSFRKVTASPRRRQTASRASIAGTKACSGTCTTSRARSSTPTRHSR